MRRQEEKHEVRLEPPPFRVLSGTSSYLSPTSPPQLSAPPPTRAPDPYRISAPTSIYGRAHRKSSFVILTEAGSNSREPSPPSLSSGRVSPFRGRGFKGRLPHAQFSPQTPENVKAKRKSRYDSRLSVSQHNSPKRSLIPKPVSRSRSISLSKDKEKAASPKVGRRVTLRNNNNIVKHNNAINQTRKPVQTRPPLSPIKGTPSRDKVLSSKPPSRVTPGVQISKNLKSAPTKKETKIDESILEENGGSPSKIPMRKNSFGGSNPKLMISAKNAFAKTVKVKNEKNEKVEAKKKDGFKEMENQNGKEKMNGVKKVKVGEEKKQKEKEKDNVEEVKKVEETKKVEELKKEEEKKKDQVGEGELIELVKQSSQASGTHIVVNKTTTTAVRPLEVERKEKKADEEEVEKQNPVPSPVTNAVQSPEETKKEEKKVEKVEAEELFPSVDAKVEMKEEMKKVETKVQQAEEIVTEEIKLVKAEIEPVKVAEQKPVEPKQGSNLPEKKSEPETNQSVEKSLVEQGNVSLKSAQSASSIRSTDTGVSVNTVRGVSSAREKTTHVMVKSAQQIETLSGNVTSMETNGEPNSVPSGSEEPKTTRQKLLSRWRKSFGNYCKCCPDSMRCLACRRDPKGLLWPKNQAKKIVEPVGVNEQKPPGRWSRLKKACRCSSLVQKCHMPKLWKQKARVAPVESTNCCPPERRFGTLCRGLFSRCLCKNVSFKSCCSFKSSCSSCCKRSEAQRTRSIRAKHSLTSVVAPPLSEEQRQKIPDVLIEHNSLMRAAIPCLPTFLAWFCLIWNIFLPGTGTFWSGVFNLCFGQPRFGATASPKARIGAFIVNLIVGVGQAFTVLFCLVGWGWSIWWGITMIRLARKYKRYKDSEAVHIDAEAGRAGDGTAIAAGVASQSLREAERAR